MLCLECGKEYRHLGSHVSQKHRLLARDYKIKHGLDVGASLIEPDIQEKLRASNVAHADLIRTNLMKGASSRIKKGERLRKYFSPKFRSRVGKMGKGNWLGDDAGYSALHAHVNRYLGSPRLCAHCGTTDAMLYDWANVSGQYKRDLSDWIRLCRSCHKKFDNGREDKSFYFDERGHRKAQAVKAD